jgi:thiosulfate/3-mercaptopyruvate sulfurtransferase
VIAVDARHPDEYAGTVAEEGVDRPGHIPGSTNLEWASLFSAGRLKSKTDLEALFQAADATADKTVVAYCRVGSRASALYFAARVAGRRVKMYDGSMVDWSRRRDLPVATGPGRGTP